MNNGGRNTPASDQSQKELSISLAASSMINASDKITQEAYQANLRRIQEVREMVRRLEVNNEVAHKNFLLDQLEKRAKDGREAEDMLARLRNQPGLSESVHFTNNVPSDKSEVILPTTATLVEVPESHSSPSYSSPAPATASHPPQTMQQGRPAQHQWSLPPQVHKVPSYNPDNFRYYIPSTSRQPPQHSAVPHSQAPVNPGQMNWYTTQNVPPQSRVHNPLVHQTGFQPIQVQQPSQSWSSYPHQVIALPAADTVPAPGYTSPGGWIRTVPAHGGPNATSSNPTYREPGFLRQPTASQPPVTTYNQPQNPPSLTPTSQVQVPLQGVPAGPVTIPSGQPHPIHPKPAQSQSQPVTTAISKPIAISELQRLPKLLQQPQQQPRIQPQRPPQPALQPQQHSQQSEVQLSSQRRGQTPPTHLQVPPQSANHAPSTNISQPHTQLSETIIVQEQAGQRGPQPRADHAMFIQLFQTAVRSGTLEMKAFWFQAKASGISDEWLNAAINSLPRDVWQSAVARANQSRPTLHTPPSENAPHQQVLTIPGPNVPVISAPPPLTATPLVQKCPATQQSTKPSTSIEGRDTHSAPGQTSGSYAAQLQYYAEQATNSALSAQMASSSTTPQSDITPTQTTVGTPKRDVPQAQAQADVRTPRDANRSTLARDILRSLVRIVPKPHQEVRGKPTDKANNHEDDQLPEVTPSQPFPRVTSPKSSAVPPASSFVDASSPSVPSAKPIVQEELQHITSPSPLTALKHGQAAVIEGPIMIDLTLEDSDESVDGKGQDPTFPMQTSASAATSSQLVPPTNTINHTPLLESLSLEELPSDVAANGDNADVRMYSPSLPFTAKENMDSEVLCPPLGSTESVSPSFEQLPREASEHPLDGQLPLFLPSPPISPAPTEPPETDLEMTNDEGESRPSLKRSSDVDEMEIDTGFVTPPHVRKRGKQQVYVLIPQAPLYVKKAIKNMKERATGEGSHLITVQYSHLEQLLIEESKSRLLERRCRWLNCGAVLNCAANLLAHLKDHAREEDSQVWLCLRGWDRLSQHIPTVFKAPFLCRWASCRRQFGMEQERDVHLEKHTIIPLPCPFAGCDEQFDKPVEVMQHEVQHQKVDRREPLIRKPTCRPVVPAIPARLGPPPQRLPSHRVIPRRIVKCRISADRHAVVGPWVLWNIFSPIELNMRKQNASMHSRPTRQSITYDIDSSDHRRDDYDFLLALSSYPAKNPRLDDLDSTLITMSAARGLTLWGSESTVNSARGSTTPEEYMNAVSVTLAVDAAVPSSATEETKVEGKSDGSEVADARGNNIRKERQSTQSVVMGEEDAVERMLIL
ncbi:hypothetical protein J3R83DRAFT_720 [Lanmaoa asiatica]|nr:hypothetical protein J3R83DRAFT_720 [Lanmaoa asiatica]